MLYSDTRYFETIYNEVRDKHVVVYGSKESIEKLMSRDDDFFEKDTEFASIHNEDLTDHNSYFELIYGGENRAYNTNLIGDYNVENIVAAIISSLLIGIPMIRSEAASEMYMFREDYRYITGRIAHL